MALVLQAQPYKRHLTTLDKPSLSHLLGEEGGGGE